MFIICTVVVAVPELIEMLVLRIDQMTFFLITHAAKPPSKSA